MTKKRRALQVSPEFYEKLVKLQKEIMMSGELKSLRDLTEEICKSPAFEEIKKRLISKKNVNINMKIHFDRRLLG